MEIKYDAKIRRSATIYQTYDAGTVDISSAEETTIETAEQIHQLLLYPTVDCFVKINDSVKEIFIPKTMWTPISIACEQFTIRTTETGVAYWQGWVV